MSYEIREPTPAELRAFYAAPAVPKMQLCFGLWQEGNLAIVSGLLTDPAYLGSALEDEARVIGFLDVKAEVSRRAALDVVRSLNTWLKRCGRDVWVQHDDAFPASERLLRTLGFRPTHVTRHDFQHTGRALRMWARPA